MRIDARGILFSHTIVIDILSHVTSQPVFTDIHVA